MRPPFRADQVGSLLRPELKGNPLREAQQEAKLARIVEMAAKVWRQ
jgi:hypothetical protein